MTGRSEAAAERHSDHGPGRRGSRGFAIAACALVVAATVASFSPSLRNDFVDWDDHIAIQTNPHIRGLGPENIRWMFTSFHLGPYQPLAWLSLAADHAIWGLNPFGFHLTSLVIHAVNGLLVLALSLALLVHAERARAGRPPAGTLADAGDGGVASQGALLIGATVSALLFAIHPLRVESVAWATERRDVLMGFFLLLSSLTYVRAVALESDAAGRRRRLVLSQVLYLLALLSKSSALGFPVVLLLIDAVVFRRLPLDPRRWLAAPSRAVLIEKLPYVLLAAVLAVVALRGQEEAHAIRDVDEAGIERRIGAAIYSPAFYLWKLALPVGLSPLYEAPRDFARMRPAVIASAIVLAAITVVVLSQRERRPALAGAWLSYAVLLAPVSGLVPIGSHVAADRYTYVAMLPFALLAGGAAVALLRRGRGDVAIPIAAAGTTPRRALMAVLFVVALFASLGFATARQTRVWRDSLSLWEHALRLDPGSAIAQYGRGFALWRLGQEEAAIASYREAIRLSPDYADAHNNLGTILAQRGALDDAEQHFLAAERGYPANAISQYNLGIIAGKRGRLDEAAARYRRALAQRPEMSSARINLAQVLSTRGEADSARALLDEGLRIAPGDSSLVRAIESAAPPR